MKRKFAALFLAVLLSAGIPFGLTGCGNEEDSGKTTIRYWSIYPTGDPYTPKHQAYIDQFEKDNPDIKIEHLGTNFWDYFSKLKTSQAGGEVIDVYWQDLINVKFRASQGVAANLSPYIEQNGIDISQWVAADIEACSYEGGIYALPFEGDVRVLYYNKDHFKEAGLDPEQPPKNFEELADYAKKLTKKSADGKRYERVGFHPRLGNNQIQQIVWNMGGEFFDDNMNPTFNTPQVIEAISWWVELARSYELRLMNAFTTAHSDGSGKDQSFMQGATSMVIDENGLAWQIAENNPDLNYGVAPVPYNGENRHALSGGFTLEMSAKTTGKKAEAAWKFIQYMTDVEIQKRTLPELGFTPANMKAIEIMKESANTNQQIIFDQFQYKKHADYLEASPEWWSIIAEQLSKAEGNKDVSIDKAAKDAAAAAQVNIEKVIKEYEMTH